MAANKAVGPASLAEPHPQLDAPTQQDVGGPAAAAAAAEERRSAATKVFNIYEILENILQRVSPRDILGLKSLCKRAENVVDNSMSIIKRLHSPVEKLSDTQYIIPLPPKFIQQASDTGIITINSLHLKCGVSGIWKDFTPFHIQAGKMDVSFCGYKKGDRRSHWGGYRYNIRSPDVCFTLAQLGDIVGGIVKRHEMAHAKVHFNLPDSNILDAHCGMLVRQTEGPCVREDILPALQPYTPLHPDRPSPIGSALSAQIAAWKRQSLGVRHHPTPLAPL